MKTFKIDNVQVISKTVDYDLYEKLRLNGFAYVPSTLLTGADFVAVCAVDGEDDDGHFTYTEEIFAVVCQRNLSSRLYRIYPEEEKVDWT